MGGGSGRGRGEGGIQVGGRENWEEEEEGRCWKNRSKEAGYRIRGTPEKKARSEAAVEQAGRRGEKIIIGWVRTESKAGTGEEAQEEGERGGI